MEYTPQELALQIRKIIETNPHNWQQAVWYGYESNNFDVADIRQDMEKGTCGTVACVAGWAAIVTSPKGTRLKASALLNNLDSVIYPNGREARIHIVAKDALGLTDDQANFLFDSCRTKDEVISILTDIENGFDWYN